MKTKLGIAILIIFASLYLALLGLILGWLSQFVWYPFWVKSVGVSLSAIAVAAGLFLWSDERDERQWAAEVSWALARPFVLYLSAIGCCLYALGCVVVAPFLVSSLVLSERFGKT